MTGLVKMTWNETKLLWREPLAIFFSLAFPTLMLVILGIIPSFREPVKHMGGVRPIDLYVPITVLFAITMLGLTSLPTTLATYREKGILRRMAVTPVPPTRVIQAQMLMSLFMGIGAVVLLLAVGRVVFAVPLPAQLAGFMLAFVLSAAALFAMGLAIAALMPNARAASAVGTLLYFPLMFFAGLWAPRAVMPAILRQISDFTPLGAGAQAMHDTTAGMWPQALHLLVMAVTVVVFSVIASRLFRWQ